MPTVLIVEDCAERDAVLRRRFVGYDVTIARSYDEAVAHLQEAYFDVVSLDYDLGGANGNDVAMRLAELSVPARPSHVVIHSMNPVGAQRIAATLRTAGIPSYVQPFSV